MTEEVKNEFFAQPGCYNALFKLYSFSEALDRSIDLAKLSVYSCIEWRLRLYKMKEFGIIPFDSNMYDSGK